MLLSFGKVASAGVPVTPASNQTALLTSNDTRLAAEKQVVYDFWRIVLIGRHLDQATTFMRDDYIQHNPNVPTGRAAFVEFFSRIRKPEPIQAGWKNKPTLMFASGPYVFLIVKRAEKDPDDPNQTYPAYWFDMVRVENGMIQEHWDAATKNPPAPR